MTDPGPVDSAGVDEAPEPHWATVSGSVEIAATLLLVTVLARGLLYVFTAFQTVNESAGVNLQANGGAAAIYARGMDAEAGMLLALLALALRLTQTQPPSRWRSSLLSTVTVVAALGVLLRTVASVSMYTTLSSAGALGTDPFAGTVGPAIRTGVILGALDFIVPAVVVLVLCAGPIRAARRNAPPPEPDFLTALPE